MQHFTKTGFNRSEKSKPILCQDNNSITNNTYTKKLQDFLQFLFQNWECKVLIPLSEYSKSVCVLWMFTEAFFLHQVVYGKYSTTRRRTGLYTLIGWGKYSFYLVKKNIENLIQRKDALLHLNVQYKRVVQLVMCSYL